MGESRESRGRVESRVDLIWVCYGIRECRVVFSVDSEVVGDETLMGGLCYSVGWGSCESERFGLTG